MLQNIVRTFLTAHFENKPLPSIAELGFSEDHAYVQSKHLAFVTLYRDGAVIASSGRVHNNQKSTIQECLDNALEALKDERAAGIDLSALSNVQIRVDVIQSADRRILTEHGQMDQKNEGLIILSQNLGKLAVLLPGIAGADKTSAELFAVVCKKAGIPVVQSPADYVLYAIHSTVFSDF